MSLYWDVLEAAHAAVEAIEMFALRTPPVPVQRWKEPKWNPAAKMAIQVLVCPEKNLTPNLGEGATAEHYGRGAELVFPIYVGIIHDSRLAEATLRFRMDAADAVQDALWSLEVAAAGGGFQVAYDPSGAGAERSNAPNVDETWVRFDFTISADRTSDTNG